MTKTIILLCMAGLMALMPLACKKDSMPSPAKPPLLTRISGNGITRIELSYDTERRLSRVNFFFNGTFSTYTLIEYDETGITEARRYDAGNHALDYRRVFSLDNFGRVIKSEHYSTPDFDAIASVSEFDYNASDQLISNEFRIPGNPVYTREEYAYDDQGNRTSLKKIRDPGQPGEFLWYQYDYTSGEKPVPPEWEDYLFLLEMLGLKDYIADIFITSKQYKSWDNTQQLQSDYKFETSGKVFNEQGYLTGQLIIRKNILNPGPDQEQEMVYEYSQ